MTAHGTFRISVPRPYVGEGRRWRGRTERRPRQREKARRGAYRRRRGDHPVPQRAAGGGLLPPGRVGARRGERLQAAILRAPLLPAQGRDGDAALRALSWLRR